MCSPEIKQVIITNPSIDSSGLISDAPPEFCKMEPIIETGTLTVADDGDFVNNSNCGSPASSQGGVYSVSALF